MTEGRGALRKGNRPSHPGHVPPCGCPWLPAAACASGSGAARAPCGMTCGADAGTHLRPPRTQPATEPSASPPTTLDPHVSVAQHLGVPRQFRVPQVRPSSSGSPGSSGFPSPQASPAHRGPVAPQGPRKRSLREGSQALETLRDFPEIRRLGVSMH